MALNEHILRAIDINIYKKAEGTVAFCEFVIHIAAAYNT